MDLHAQTVEALRALCSREGGHKAVALAAGVSADNLWQVLHGTLLPNGKPRGVGRQLASKLNAAFPGWMSVHPASAGEQPASYRLAHDVSHLQLSDDLPLLEWESIMNNKTPELFRVALPDDSMAPDLPRGSEVVWTTRRRLMPGRVVLVVDRHSQLHVRRCHQGRAPGHWLAVASNPAYRTLDSEADGLTPVAIYKGLLEPDDA